MPAPIKGTKGNDLNLNGTNGNDKLQGKGGNDTIFGGKGNDDIDGGQGFDTAVYLGSFWDYVITVKGTGNDKVTVHDTVANRDGTDSLKQVEALQFGDGTVIRLDQNNAAVTRNDAATTNEDTSTVVDVLANDKDFEGDALTITAINGIAIAIGGSVVLASGATVTLNANQTLTYNPNGSFETLNNGGPNDSDLFQYTVTDSKGASSTGNASVTITGVNDAPVANNDSASTDEDTPVNINVRGNDTDVDVGDTLTITHVDGTAIAVGGTVAVSGGTVMLNADGTLTYTPNDALGGSTVQHNFSYTVSDGDASSTANVAVDVEGLDEPPAFTGINHVNPTGVSQTLPQMPMSDGSAVFTEVRDGAITIAQMPGDGDAVRLETYSNGGGRLRVNVGYDSDERFLLGDLQDLKFDFYVQASDNPDSAPVIRLFVDADGNLATIGDRGELVFERVYQGFGATPIGSKQTADLAGDDWVAWQRSASTNWDQVANMTNLSNWADADGFGANIGLPLNFSESSLVLGFAIAYGSGNGTGVMYINNLSVNGVAYDIL
jgi:hypothetical protein